MLQSRLLQRHWHVPSANCVYSSNAGLNKIQRVFFFFIFIRIVSLRYLKVVD